MQWKVDEIKEELNILNYFNKSEFNQNPCFKKAFMTKCILSINVYTIEYKSQSN